MMKPDHDLPGLDDIQQGGDLLPGVADVANEVLDELEPTPFGEMPRAGEEVEINGVRCVIKRHLNRGRILIKTI
jgi:hypothetical protein